MTTKPIYQIYVELSGYNPAIWRRFLVQDDLTMMMLSHIIMTMFEMDGSYEFCFNIPVVNNLKLRMAKTKILPANYDENLEKYKELTKKRNMRIQIFNNDRVSLILGLNVINLRDVTLADIFAKRGEKASFSYDCRNDWKINIKIEKIITNKEFDESELPCILAGEGMGIVEDCGGTWALSDIADALEEGSGDEYEAWVAEFGIDELDLLSFDIESMNCKLQKLLTRSARINKKN